MVVGELDSVLATTSRCMPSSQAELACVCAQRFVHRVCAQLFVHPSLQTTGCKKSSALQRARFLNKRPSLESQASELGETAEQPRF